MHGPINVKSPNNISKWQMGFNSAFKGLTLKNSTCFALSVFYGPRNRQQPLLYTSLTDRFFMTVVENIYSAVRTDSLYKADYASSLKS
jgi:hypothetical protein